MNVHFNMYGSFSAYRKKLDAIAADVKLRSEAEQIESNKPLTVKIHEWWLSLPPDERQRPYTMRELVYIFKTAPGLIGMALVELGWRRRRQWRGNNYRRYWLPAGHLSLAT